MTLLASIRSTLKDRTSSMSGLPGGIWHHYAPQAAPSPSATYAVIHMDSNETVAQGILNFTVHGPDSNACRDSLAKACEILSGQPIPCEEGAAMFRQNTEIPETKFGVIGSGKTVFSCTAMLPFFVVK